MELLIIIPVIAVIIICVLINNKKTPKQDYQFSNPLNKPYSKNNIDLTNGYTSKWLFSYNEKNAFYKIKSVTDKLGFYLFAKVRLYDLIEPKNKFDKDKTLLWKIQAKHVDFVICDQNLVAKVIIELDDSSHNKYRRQERDEFVDLSLFNCGYKILRYKYINPEILESELSTYSTTSSQVHV